MRVSHPSGYRSDVTNFVLTLQNLNVMLIQSETSHTLIMYIFHIMLVVPSTWGFRNFDSCLCMFYIILLPGEQLFRNLLRTGIVRTYS